MLEADIQQMAEYCLKCPNKPCSNEGCPMHTPIPEFIECVKNENIDYAYKLLTDNNVFSGICAQICPQEKQCESKCVRGIKGNPVSIGRLERYVNHAAREDHLVFIKNPMQKNGKRVAIVGSGPAGLECAYELILSGFDVDVYEKEGYAGGLLKYGIPDFRLKKKKVDDVIRTIKHLGVNFHFKKALGKDITIDGLKKEYDYVFVATGLAKAQTYSLCDEKESKIKGVYKPEKVLKAYFKNDYIQNLGIVAVIGGGDVAMDCARVARKMGADEVKILYRRDKEHMPASKKELEGAIVDGVIFKEMTRVISANCEDEKIVSLNCIETELVDGNVIDKENAEVYTEEANSVIFAIGLKTDKKLMEEQGIELDGNGLIKVDEDGMTSIENVYAGGDLTESNATVCYAIASGKKVANAIIKKENK